jgi:hypothetical protein
MRRRVIPLLLISILPLAGCSYRYDFVVVNKSGGPIQVEYRLKRHTPETPGEFVEINPPAKMSLGEFQKSKHDWRNLSKDAYGWDNATGTFSVNVASAEALLVDYTYNYGGSEDQFHLMSIKITGAKGSIDLEGRQAQTQFKVESDTNYVLEYR